MSKKQAKKIDDSASAAPVVADETSIILSPRSTSSTSMSDTTVGHQQLTRYITAIASAEYDRRSFAFTASMSKALSAGQKLLQVLVKSHKETSKQLAETQESVLQLKSITDAHERVIRDQCEQAERHQFQLAAQNEQLSKQQSRAETMEAALKLQHSQLEESVRSFAAYRSEISIVQERQQLNAQLKFDATVDSVLGLFSFLVSRSDIVDTLVRLFCDISVPIAEFFGQSALTIAKAILALFSTNQMPTSAVTPSSAFATTVRRPDAHQGLSFQFQIMPLALKFGLFCYLFIRSRKYTQKVGIHHSVGNFKNYITELLDAFLRSIRVLNSFIRSFLIKPSSVQQPIEHQFLHSTQNAPSAPKLHNE